MELIPCENEGACPVFEKEGRCRTDIHHTIFPRRNYKTKIEKKFRELDVNKVRICRLAHNALHATGIMPPKPTRDEMCEAIRHKSDTI